MHALRVLSVALAPIALAGLAPLAQAQAVDMQAITRWSKARVVHYRIEGAYEGATPVSANKTYAVGDVTDRAVIEIDWDLRKQELLGTPKFQNAKSETKNPRNPEKKCTAPVLKGPYEHFEIAEVKQDQRGRILVRGTRTYPDADVNTQCPASLARSPVRGRQEEASEILAVPSPMLLAVGAQAKASNATVSPDGKSFSLKTGGWTWTYTPTEVPK